MRIKYNTTIEDLIAFNEFFVGLLKPQKILYRGIVIGIIAVFVTSIYSGWRSGEWFANVFALVPVSIFFAYLFLTRKRRFAKSIRKSFEDPLRKGALGLQELDLTNDYLSISTQCSSYKVTWDIVKKAQVVPGYVFILIGPQDGLVINKANITEGNFDELVSFLHQQSQLHPSTQK
jgi:hypothetical protein